MLVARASAMGGCGLGDGDHPPSLATAAAAGDDCAGFFPVRCRYGAGAGTVDAGTAGCPHPRLVSGPRPAPAFCRLGAAVLQLLICLAGIGVMLLIEYLARYWGRAVARRAQETRTCGAACNTAPLSSLGGLCRWPLPCWGWCGPLWSVAASGGFLTACRRPDHALLDGAHRRPRHHHPAIHVFGDGFISAGCCLAVIWLEHRRPPGAGFER